MAIPLIIPSTLPYTIPSTTLFAVCVVYGRLSHDNEIIAVKAAGVHILKAVWPAILLGALTSGVTLALYAKVIPETQYTLRATFLRNVEEFFYAMLANDRTINHPRLNYAIWVRQVQGRRLLDATFKRRDLRGEFDLIARAREADLLFDYRNKKVVVRMRHGEVYNIPTNAHAFFEYQEWEEKMPESPVDASKRKAREMSWRQLYQQAALYEAEVVQLDQEIAEELEETTRSKLKDPAQHAQHVNNLRTQQQAIRGELRAIQSEQHLRPVIALGCLCFAVVGAPVGIWFSKRDYLSAFITCFSPIMLIYYPLLLGGHSLARTGRVPPLYGIWVCDIVAGLAGIYLLRRLLRN
jgi:lipopolysaccharide export system permease protein